MNKAKRTLGVMLGGIGVALGLVVAATAQKDLGEQGSAEWHEEESRVAPMAEPSQPSTTGIAVVELFTSEGCSSCPPADRNLARLAEKFAGNKSPVFLLAYHVDYWNDLGWVDRFSAQEFSLRQREYAKVLSEHSVYTPQMVVNGRWGFNGADRELSDDAIADALADKESAAFQLTIDVSTQSQKLVATYRASNPSFSFAEDSPYILHVATVLDQDKSQVTSGENAGLDLSHVWVVRQLSSTPLTQGRGALAIDEKRIQKGRTKLVAFVQEKQSRRIVGATAISL